ncbi:MULTISPECIES: copper homeostasis protein CutC [unclassified Agarivorans]|uniref:copper homeostasis protein CutC n=1 Tax=unclassified Agarivorans TaxID=2636026 RepID=UPI003D7D7E55
MLNNSVVSFPLLEVCCYSVADIEKAIAGGAHRIEFCAGQSDGGTTPSYGALLQVQHYLTQIPIVVMVRPRGGDFCYQPQELMQMESDILLIKELGFHGVVSGALNPDASVDVSACQRLAKAAQGIDFVFHRAFDCVAEPSFAAKCLADIGVTRILSSGQQDKIEQGVELVLALQQQFPQLEWLAAGGVRAHNIGELLERGIQQLHSAAAEDLPSVFATQYAKAMASAKDVSSELTRQTVSQSLVQLMVKQMERGR